MNGGRSVLAVALLLGGCRGHGLLVGEPDDNLSSGGEARRPRTVPQRCPDPAALRVLDSDCWPTRHVGRWHGFVTGDARYWHALDRPLEYPSDDLLLEIDAQGSGTLRFSGGAAGSGSSAAGSSSTDAGSTDAGSTDAGSTDAGSAPGLVLGFRYALSQLSMTGGPNAARWQDPRVDFSLDLEQPAPCSALGADAGPCACGGAQPCRAASDSLQVALVLSADGSALRGSARSDRPTESLTASWEFVRE